MVRGLLPKSKVTYIQKYKTHCDICGKKIEDKFNFGTYILRKETYIRLTQSKSRIGEQEQMALCEQCSAKLFLFISKLYEGEPTGMQGKVTNFSGKPVVVNDLGE